ncbi:MAG: hypothetical protein NT009_05095 [Proteobacteria bacterium]|nr:hypothetical protein [Pseudomonadota bacterium]
MKSKEPAAMREIHRIRERNYLRTKNLSVEKRIEQTRRIAQRVLKEFDLIYLSQEERKTAGQDIAVPFLKDAFRESRGIFKGVSSSDLLKARRKERIREHKEKR